MPQHPDILRALRREGEALDYYVERNGTVLLLEHQPFKYRVIHGRQLLTAGIRTVDALLMVDGWALLDDLPPWSLWSGELVFRAHQLMHVTPAMVEAAHAAKLAESDNTARDLRHERHMRARIQADYRSDHRIFFRHRRSFANPLRDLATSGNLSTPG